MICLIISPSVHYSYCTTTEQLVCRFFIGLMSAARGVFTIICLLITISADCVSVGFQGVSSSESTEPNYDVDFKHQRKLYAVIFNPVIILCVGILVIGILLCLTVVYGAKKSTPKSKSKNSKSKSSSGNSNEAESRKKKPCSWLCCCCPCCCPKKTEKSPPIIPQTPVAAKKKKDNSDDSSGIGKIGTETTKEHSPNSTMYDVASLPVVGFHIEENGLSAHGDGHDHDPAYTHNKSPHRSHRHGSADYQDALSGGTAYQGNEEEDDEDEESAETV